MMRELFYKFFFTNYKMFITDKNIRFGKEKASQREYSNPYNSVLLKYENELRNRGNSIIVSNLELKERDFNEEHLSEAIDLFFHIISNYGNDDVKEHVNKLLQFISEGGNSVEQRDVLIEDGIAACILKFFWGKVNGKNLRRQKNSDFKNQFLTGQKRYEYNDIICLIEDLLDNSNYHKIADFLRVVKAFRNSCTHFSLGVNDGYIQLSYSDACIISLFILYTYITTVLYLLTKLKIKEDYHPLTLNIVFNNVDSERVNIQLYDMKTHTTIDENEGNFAINRYHKYKLSVEQRKSIEFTPKWYSLSPIVTIKDNNPQYRDNEFEQIASERNATLQSILDVNKKTNEILNIIRYDHSEQTKELKNALNEQTNVFQKALSEQTFLFQKLADIIKNDNNWDQVRENIIDLYNYIIESKEDIKNTTKDEGNKTRKYIKNWSIVIISIFAIIGFMDFNKTCQDVQIQKTPEELIEEGDRLLKDENFEQAGEIYRKAIRVYEDSLSVDSNDVKANIGLAMMLMRGKGDYDLNRALQCVKRVINDRRGEGLYLYLLTLNGKNNEADDYLRQKMYTPVDDYAKLTDAMLTIYGHKGERTGENISAAYSTLSSLSIQEAKLELAQIIEYGVKTDNGNNFWIPPTPVESSFFYLQLARDSLNPLACALLSDFYYKIGNIQQAFNSAYQSFVCGVKESSHMLRIIMLIYTNLDESEESMKTLFETITRISGQQSSVEASLTNFIQELYKWEKNKGGISTNQLIEDIEGLITLIENEKDNYYSLLLDELYHKRVSFYLETENLSMATQLAMKIDNCQDSTAVLNYLQGICYAKGYGKIKKDSLKSDSLIELSANKGYVEAMYTRLRHSIGVGKWLTEEMPDYSKKNKDKALGILNNSISSKNKTIKDENTSFKELMGKNYQKQTAFVEAPPTLTIDTIFVKVKKTYFVSPCAVVPDSVWKHSPKFAMALDKYWFPYYDERHEKSPYFPFCPKDYQIMSDVAEDAFEEVNDSLYQLKKIDSKTYNGILYKIDEGIAYAMSHKRSQIARLLITLKMSLMRSANENYFKINYYENLALPEYRKGGIVKMFSMMDFPIYAY